MTESQICAIFLQDCNLYGILEEDIIPYFMKWIEDIFENWNMKLKENMSKTASRCSEILDVHNGSPQIRRALVHCASHRNIQ